MAKLKKIIFIVIILVVGVMVGIIFRPHKSSISELYNQKGILVTQKAELLRIDLDTRNKIDEINKQVSIIDGKLTKLINPQTFTGVEATQTGAIDLVNDYLSLSGKENN